MLLGASGLGIPGFELAGAANEKEQDATLRLRCRGREQRCEFRKHQSGTPVATAALPGIRGGLGPHGRDRSISWEVLGRRLKDGES